VRDNLERGRTVEGVGRLVWVADIGGMLPFGVSEPNVPHGGTYRIIGWSINSVQYIVDVD